VVRAAARIGYTFGMDPIEVLKERDPLHRKIREAALMVWVEDEKEKWGNNNDTDGYDIDDD
jgi:hypothetical protein